MRPVGARRVDREADDARRQRRHERAPLAEPADDGAHEPALDRHRAHAHHGQRPADFDALPAVAIDRVEHEHALQRLMGELKQEVQRRESAHVGRPDQGQRSERVRTPPVERGAAFGRQRLGEHQQPVHRVRETERGGHPERRARSPLAEQPAHCRAEDEAHAEGRAEQPIRARAPVGGRDIGDVRVGRRNAGGRDPRRARGPRTAIPASAPRAIRT